MLIILILCVACPAQAENCMPLELSSQQRYAANLFLSNFTELGMNLDRIERPFSHMQLVDFAHDHMWANSYDSFEYGEFPDGNNCRVSDEGIQTIIDSFFYFPPEVDLSCTRFDYDGEYYYHCETGGWSQAGFAHVIDMRPVEKADIYDGYLYYVSFMVFGDGAEWTNDVLGDSLEEVLEKYGNPDGFGCAMVYAGDPADRSSYRMISYYRM